MPTISIRMPDAELSLLKNYAQVHNLTLSAAIRALTMERIEDEYDLEVIERYEKEKASGNWEVFSHDDVWAEIGV